MNDKEKALADEAKAFSKRSSHSKEEVLLRINDLLTEVKRLVESLITR